MTPDFPAVLLDAIRTDSANAGRWLALAAWLSVQSRDDEAIAVRVLWPTLRENLSGSTLEAILADVAAHANVFANVAREVERRATEPRD
jgi:hypothetical protein